MKTSRVLALLTFGCALTLGPALAGWMSAYWQSVLMFACVNVILATSLNIVNGNMGEFACGHAGFMAVGAYVSSALTTSLFTAGSLTGRPLLPESWALAGFLPCLVVGGIAAALSGLVIAIPSFRTRGDYLAVITLAAGYIIKSAIENIQALGGARGFMGMSKVVRAFEASVGVKPGGFPFMLVFCLMGAAASVFLVRRYIRSTYGLAVDAVRLDETAASMMGVDVNQVKTGAFLLSAGLAGLAGGLFAHVLGYVNPGSFTIMKSTECMVMVYLGGMGSISGAVLAAVGFTLLLESLRFVFPALNEALHGIGLLPESVQVTQVWKWVLIPLLLIALMQFRPEGLLGRRELTDQFPRLRRLLGMGDRVA